MNRTLRTLSLVCLAVTLCSCAAATRPASPDRPRAADAPKFVAFDASDERRTAALASWRTIVGEQSATNSNAPELRPVTATISALPARLDAPPRLPLVVISDEKTQTEEEKRESLRRFIQTAAPLIGADPKELTLVEVTELQNGARTARYRQSAFQYPLRNGYGEVSITFTEDLRVLALSSTAIPNAEQLRRSLATVAQELPAFDPNTLNGRTIAFTRPGGIEPLTSTITQNNTKAVRQLVVFPVRRGDADVETLELHVAWEVSVGPFPLLAYVDAVTGEVLGGIVSGTETTTTREATPTRGS